MRNITLCFALIMLCILNLSAQTFQNIIGTQEKDEQGLSVAASVDGNMLFAGTLSKFGKDYPLLLSLNADGTVNKAATIESLGGTISNSVNIAPVHTAKGKPNGYIVVMNYSYDIIVVRLNNYARIVWSKKLSSTTDVPIKIQPTYSPITNYLAGFYLLADQYAHRHTLIKLSAEGEIIWQKQIANPADSYGYYARNILPTNDGGCIVVGERKELKNWNSSIAKFGPSGSLVWNRSYDFFSDIYERISAIAEANDGYVLSGYNLIFKIDTAGNALWANQFDLSNESRPKKLLTETNGNIVFTGAYHDTADLNNAFIVKLNSSGNVIFGKRYYFNAQMNDITLTPEGYCAIGTTSPGLFNDPDNVYILKTDFSGNVGGNCSPTTMSIIKTPYEFINITEPRFKITTDTFTANNITLISRNLNNIEENWCGSSVNTLDKTFQHSTALTNTSFKVYTNISTKEIVVQYITENDVSNNKYEVILYNSAGIALDKKSLQLNIHVPFSMSQQPPGIYIAVLLKEGKIMEKQTVVWIR